jgi:hypothetical protein
MTPFVSALYSHDVDVSRTQSSISDLYLPGPPNVSEESIAIGYPNRGKRLGIDVGWTV